MADETDCLERVARLHAERNKLDLQLQDALAENTRLRLERGRLREELNAVAVEREAARLGVALPI